TVPAPPAARSHFWTRPRLRVLLIVVAALAGNLLLASAAVVLFALAAPLAPTAPAPPNACCPQCGLNFHIAGLEKMTYEQQHDTIGKCPRCGVVYVSSGFGTYRPAPVLMFAMMAGTANKTPTTDTDTGAILGGKFPFKGFEP